MAIFVSASDETKGPNHLGSYQCTGLFAPESDWSRLLVPQWQKRVLDGPPPISYLHVSELRRGEWRTKRGITARDAENRLNEAARIIEEIPSLYPVKIQLDNTLFKKLFAPHQMIVNSGGKKTYEPDYYAFVTYVFAVLNRVKVKYPDATKVNFIVESNGKITKHIGELYDSLPNALRHIDRSDLIPLLGDFTSGSKHDIPLQAADYICWHSQRADAGTLIDKHDIRRWNALAKRKAFVFPVPGEMLRHLAEAFADRGDDTQAAS